MVQRNRSPATLSCRCACLHFPKSWVSSPEGITPINGKDIERPGKDESAKRADSERVNAIRPVRSITANVPVWRFTWSDRAGQDPSVPETRRKGPVGRANLPGMTRRPLWLSCPKTDSISVTTAGPFAILSACLHWGLWRMLPCGPYRRIIHFPIRVRVGRKKSMRYRNGER